MKLSDRHVRGKKQKTTPFFNRLLWQLFACGVVLMLVLALRMFVPGFESWLKSTMEKQTKVKAVFSTLGEGLSGKTTWKETWQEEARMVFGQENETEPVFAQAENREKSEKQEEKSVLTSPLIPTMEYTAATGQITPLGYKADETAAAVAAFTARQTTICDDVPDWVRYDAPALALSYTMPSNGVVTSPFGYRSQPSTGELQFHHGTDYGGEVGEDVFCFAEGTVTGIGEDDVLGKYVVVQHEDGVVTEYGHLCEISVSSGQSVSMGQALGKMGETGNATGPCLHFVLLIDGWFVNPEYYLI